MEFPNSAYWSPNICFPSQGFLQFTPFSFCMTLYPNFQNENNWGSQQGHPFNEPQYEPSVAIPMPLYTQDDGQQEGNDQGRNEIPIRKSRTHKRRQEVNKEHRILRECLEPVKHDRNIQSNALKLFLKYMRNDSKFQCSPVQKIIMKKKLEYSPQQFISDLNEVIDPTLNYIRPCQIKQLCQTTQKQNFSLVFRTCLKEFFTKQIHMVSTKPIRTNRYVRWEQIKAGRKLIEGLFNN